MWPTLPSKPTLQGWFLPKLAHKGGCGWLLRPLARGFNGHSHLELGGWTTIHAHWHPAEGHCGVDDHWCPHTGFQWGCQWSLTPLIDQTWIKHSHPLVHCSSEKGWFWGRQELAKEMADSLVSTQSYLEEKKRVKTPSFQQDGSQVSNFQYLLQASCISLGGGIPPPP